jgi:hypothetical protein
VLVVACCTASPVKFFEPVTWPDLVVAGYDHVGPFLRQIGRRDPLPLKLAGLNPQWLWRDLFPLR